MQTQRGKSKYKREALEFAKDQTANLIKLLRNNSKKRIKKKLNKMKRLLTEKLMTIEKAEQILNSWLGHAKQANSYNFINKLLNKYDFIKLEKGILKINRSVINNGQ